MAGVVKVCHVWMYRKSLNLFQIGIIGGSGLHDPDILQNKTTKSVDTPYGKVLMNNVILHED